MLFTIARLETVSHSIFFCPFIHAFVSSFLRSNIHLYIHSFIDNIRFSLIQTENLFPPGLGGPNATKIAIKIDSGSVSGVIKPTVRAQMFMVFSLKRSNVQQLNVQVRCTSATRHNTDKNDTMISPTQHVSSHHTNTSSDLLCSVLLSNFLFRSVLYSYVSFSSDLFLP